MRTITIQNRLETITNKWWFYLIFLAGQVLAIFPFASKQFSLSNFVEIAQYSLGYALIGRMSQSLFPIFKLLPIILIILVFLRKNGVGRVFCCYVGLSYLLFAIVQNVAITEKYGLSFITVNVVMFSLVGLSWLWEAVVRVSDFKKSNFRLSLLWIIPMALFAFWTPGNPQTGLPDFNPTYLLTQNTGLAFCLMTPVYLTILIIFYPFVNLVTMRINSLVGLFLGIYNMGFIFGMKTGTWYVGLLHLPLLLISAYALYLSLRPVEQRDRPSSKILI